VIQASCIECRQMFEYLFALLRDRQRNGDRLRAVIGPVAMIEIIDVPAGVDGPPPQAKNMPDAASPVINRTVQEHVASTWSKALSVPEEDHPSGWCGIIRTPGLRCKRWVRNLAATGGGTAYRPPTS
jgi:hypothetical protein